MDQDFVRRAVRDVRNNVLVNEGLIYKLRDLGSNIWYLRIHRPGGQRCARIEIIIDEYDNPENRGVRGAIIRYGDIPRHQIALIMDSIMERL